jgi:predicted acyl esterase
MLVTALAGDGQGQPDAYDAREHYTKYECRIPMRDGVRLFTAVLVPKDASTTYPSWSFAAHSESAPMASTNIPLQSFTRICSSRPATSGCVRTFAVEGCRRVSSSM